MNITAQIARHLRDVYFGGNWTTSNFKQHLSDVSWTEATTKVRSLNTIATLLYHTNYYIAAVSKVLEGEPLIAKDQYSFDHPPLHSQEDWEKMLEKSWSDAEKFAALIEQLPDS